TSRRPVSRWTLSSTPPHRGGIRRSGEHQHMTTFRLQKAGALALAALVSVGSTQLALAAPKPANDSSVKAEHDTIGAAEDKSTGQNHTQHPDAQWYGDADFGLFIHWGICSVRAMNISWPMIPGRALQRTKLDDNELARVVRECDWNLTGKPNE